MHRRQGERIFGVETEFGCLVDDDLGPPEAAVELLKDYIFHELRLGAIDLHSRDEVFEPAQSGGFLINGSRLYIDVVGFHLEYATAECRTLKDLVANDRAGQRQIVRAIHELGLDGLVSVYDNAVDHFGGHTFGCHENYYARMGDSFFTSDVLLLIPFLVTRQIFAGAGRVGGHVLRAARRPDLRKMAENPVDYVWVSQVYDVFPDPLVDYQISQRADHILKTVAGRVRFNRALINPKWEHFYSHGAMNRLHLLFGEANQNEYAFALKVGTTSLALRLVEEGLAPERLILAHPLRALREVSRDPSYRWLVTLLDGTTISAIDLQREYLSLAQQYASDTEDIDWTLREWESVLDGLERNPMDMADRIDWVAKKAVVEGYMTEMGLGWGADALYSVDLEYHNIDPERSLFHALTTRRFVDELDIVEAMTEPPPDTRAKGRAALVRKALAMKGRKLYVFDWNGATLDRYHHVEMPNPFETYAPVEEAS